MVYSQQKWTWYSLNQDEEHKLSVFGSWEMEIPSHGKFCSSGFTIFLASSCTTIRKSYLLELFCSLVPSSINLYFNWSQFFCNRMTNVTWGIYLQLFRCEYTSRSNCRNQKHAIFTPHQGSFSYNRWRPLQMMSPRDVRSYTIKYNFL